MADDIRGCYLEHGCLFENVCAENRKGYETDRLTCGGLTPNEFHGHSNYLCVYNIVLIVSLNVLISVWLFLRLYIHIAPLLLYCIVKITHHRVTSSCRAITNPHPTKIFTDE